MQNASLCPPWAQQSKKKKDPFSFLSKGHSALVSDSYFRTQTSLYLFPPTAGLMHGSGAL